MTERLINSLNQVRPEWMWISMLLLCYVSVLVLHRFFGAAGLFAYIAVSVTGANIQVLKVVQFTVFPEPIALGTIWFSSVYLALDILTETHGPAMAKRAIFTGFATHLFFTIAMIFTAGFKPISAENPEADNVVNSHDHIVELFSPMPALFLAGMCAFCFSALIDVWVFQKVKERTSDRYLWLRNNLSTIAAAVVDSTVFSLLAWIVFASDPLPLRTVIVTYIGGSLFLRMLVAALDTPFIYFSKKLSYPDGH